MTTKTVEELPIPSGVAVSFSHNTFTIKGPKGEVRRVFNTTDVKTTVENGTIVFQAVRKYTQHHKCMIHTYKAHLKNTFRGVTEGHQYVLKICSGHFPMSVTVKGITLEVKNLLGETVPRVLPLPEGVQVKVEGDRVLVQGIDKEVTAQAAASIEQLTRRPGFDKRVFQDGLYIIEKDGRAIQ